MTKGELIEFLLPFTDELKIHVVNQHGAIVPAKIVYQILVDGEGIVLLKEENRACRCDEYWKER